MNKEEWVKSNAMSMCLSIIKDYDDLGGLYCASYLTEDGKFNILVDECQDWLTLGLSDRNTKEVIDKTQALVNHLDVFSALVFLLDWIEEEKLI